MIERIFPIGGEAEIEVTFQWDNGDPSVGIGPGWGEDTGVLINSGPLHTAIIFDVTDDDPADWPVTEIQLLDKSEQRWGTVCVDPNGATLGSLKSVCEAVRATWSQVQAKQALEVAAEDGWGYEAEISDLEGLLDFEYGLDADDSRRPGLARKLQIAREGLEAAKTRYDAMQSHYDQRYGEPIAAQLDHVAKQIAALKQRQVDLVHASLQTR